MTKDDVELLEADFGDLDAPLNEEGIPEGIPGDENHGACGDALEKAMQERKRCQRAAAAAVHGCSAFGRGARTYPCHKARCGVWESLSNYGRRSHCLRGGRRSFPCQCRRIHKPLEDKKRSIKEEGARGEVPKPFSQR